MALPSGSGPGSCTPHPQPRGLLQEEAWSGSQEAPFYLLPWAQRINTPSASASAYGPVEAEFHLHCAEALKLFLEHPCTAFATEPVFSVSLLGESSVQGQNDKYFA